MNKYIKENLKDIENKIFHCTDEIFKLDLSADKKAKISVLKFEILADFQKLKAEIEKTL